MRANNTLVLSAADILSNMCMITSWCFAVLAGDRFRIVKVRFEIQLPGAVIPLRGMDRYLSFI
jgi:hypothetical protein